MTKKTTETYDPDAQCPNFLKQLDMVFQGNKNTIDWFMKYIGYAVTGSVNEQCFLIMHGDGQNGKSTLVNHIALALGNYAKNISAETFIEQPHGNNRYLQDNADLKGARFVISGETGMGKKLLESRIKQLTSSEKLTGRYLFCETFEFTPTAKFVMTTNYIPRFAGTDKGISRRMKLLPIRHTIKDEEKNTKIDNILKEEYQGIIALIIKYSVKWNKEELGKCYDVEDYTFDIMEQQDYIGEFIDECCVFGKELEITSADITTAFQDWCKKNGIRYAAGRNTLFENLKKRGAKKDKKTVENRRIWLWQGISVRNFSYGESWTKTMPDGQLPEKLDWME